MVGLNELETSIDNVSWVASVSVGVVAGDLEIYSREQMREWVSQPQYIYVLILTIIERV